MEALELVENAHFLLENSTWIQRARARTAEGRLTDPWESNAKQFSASGAMRAILGDPYTMDRQEWTRRAQLMWRVHETFELVAMMEFGYEPVTGLDRVQEFNDLKTTTEEMVHSWFERVKEGLP